MELKEVPDRVTLSDPVPGRAGPGRVGDVTMRGMALSAGPISTTTPCHVCQQGLHR